MKLIQDYYASPLSENGLSATHVKNPLCVNNMLLIIYIHLLSYRLSVLS